MIESQKNNDDKNEFVGNPIYSLGQRLGGIHLLLEDLTSSPSSHDMMELAMATATSPQISVIVFCVQPAKDGNAFQDWL